MSFYSRFKALAWLGSHVHPLAKVESSLTNSSLTIAGVGEVLPPKHMTTVSEIRGKSHWACRNDRCPQQGVLQKSRRKGMRDWPMEVELMGTDTRPDGDNNVRVLGPGDGGEGGVINIHLSHSLMDSFNIYLVSMYYVPSVVLVPCIWC